jgi:trimeric autotransporter adhesin
MRQLWRAVLLVHAVLSVSACGVGDSNAPTPVESVVVTPQALQLLAGTAGALVAEVKDAAGNVLTGRRLVWATANQAIATVSDNGVVTGVSAGTVDIAATSEGKSAVASITVVPVPPRVSTVRIAPPTVDLFVAGGVDLVATPYDTKGVAIGGRSVVWTTNNASVAAISQTGHVTGLVPGTAVITAVIDGVGGYANVTVRLVAVAKVTISPSSASVGEGKTRTLTAQLTDAAGNVLTNRSVTWSSSNTGIATVDQSGVVRGVRRGTVTITATSEGKFGTATIKVG